MSASTSNHRAPKIAIQPEGQNSTSSQDHWKSTENTVNTNAILFPVVRRKGFKIMECWKTADRWLMQRINHMLCLYLSCPPMTTNTFSSADHSGPKSGIPLTKNLSQRERDKQWHSIRNTVQPPLKQTHKRSAHQYSDTTAILRHRNGLQVVTVQE